MPGAKAGSSVTSVAPSLSVRLDSVAAAEGGCAVSCTFTASPADQLGPAPLHRTKTPTRASPVVPSLTAYAEPSRWSVQPPGTVDAPSTVNVRSPPALAWRPWML